MAAPPCRFPLSYPSQLCLRQETSHEARNIPHHCRRSRHRLRCLVHGGAGTLAHALRHPRLFRNGDHLSLLRGHALQSRPGGLLPEILPRSGDARRLRARLAPRRIPGTAHRHPRPEDRRGELARLVLRRHLSALFDRVRLLRPRKLAQRGRITQLTLIATVTRAERLLRQSMFTARAASSPTVVNDIIACTIIISFAHGDSTGTSV